MDIDNNDVLKLREETENLNTGDFLSWAWTKFGTTMTFASSFGAEDQVVFDLLNMTDPNFDVVTLDTGRLFQETYDLIDRTKAHFNKSINILFPDNQQVEEMVKEHGLNLFRENTELRKYCCHIRKVEPLKKYLEGKAAWITGLRANQAVTRQDLNRIEWDVANNIYKLNPIIDWERGQVWNHIREREIPYNQLHDKSYPSIGCLPCTRAIQPGEDERAGRWWWESPEQKECGIHFQNGKLVRVKRNTTNPEGPFGGKNEV